MSLVSTIQGIREEIATRLNELESDNTAIYNSWLNLGLRDINYSFPNAPFLQTSADRTLSSGTRVYPSLIASAERINNITDPTDGRKLTYISPEEFDILQPSATQGGAPNVYTIRGLVWNGWFEFYPVPGSALTLHFDYQTAIDSVSAGSATSTTIPIPPKYYELMVLYGEKSGLRRKMRYDIYQTVDKQYETLKQKMMEDLMRQTSQAPRVKSVRELTRNQRTLTDPISEFFQLRS